MAGIKAVIYKDLKLFWRGMGWIAFILPFILMLLMQFGMKDLSSDRFVRSFPIAILDEDRSFMSRSMISQIREVELFSEVLLPKTPQEAEAMLRSNAVAVVTIPKDFFYDAYLYRNTPLKVTLQSKDHFGSRLFETIFTSIMDIMRNDQAITLGVYRFVYQDKLSPQQRQEMIRESGAGLLENILSRQQLFDTQASVSNIQLALLHKTTATIFAMFAMLMAFQSAKTIPDEIRLGVLPRFRTVGGSVLTFVLSKLLTAFLFSLPVLLTALFLYHRIHPMQVIQVTKMLLLYLLILLGAFAPIMLLILLSNTSLAQQLVNAVILISLFIGGTILPTASLPPILQNISQWSLFQLSLIALEGIERRSDLLLLLSPLLIRLVFFTLLSLVFGRRLLRQKSPAHKRWNKDEDLSSQMIRQTAPNFYDSLSSSLRSRSSYPIDRGSSLFCRSFHLSFFKVRATLYGKKGFMLLSLICLFVANILVSTQKNVDPQVLLLVSDQDRSTLSESLIEQLENIPTLSITRIETHDAGSALMTGKAEGLLLIPEGFGRSVLQDDPLRLHYESASASLSSQAVREIIAGKMIFLKSRLKALPQAEKKLGHILSDDEKQQLDEKIDQSIRSFRRLYTLEYAQEGGSHIPFVPESMAFASLAVLMTLFTISNFFGSIDHRRIRQRMYSLENGRLLSIGSDLAALTTLGILISLMILLFSKQISTTKTIALSCYSFCIAAMILLIRQNTKEGRVDALIPFIALMICLLGGCFIDWNSLSPQLRLLTLLSPAGQVVAATKNILFSILLIIEGGLFFALDLKK
ncbi:MAG: ABC transporter permease [Peptostreptococcaceae bacterium]|nr:ABC transporter permease [Peptostreptococcaceae bacterium]